MKIPSDCHVFERHISESEREIEMEIPNHVMHEAINAYNKRKDKRQDIRFEKISPYLDPKKSQEQFEPVVVIVTEYFEEILKNYPEKMIGEPVLSLHSFTKKSVKATGKFKVANKAIKVDQVLKVTKEKFCQAHVDKNIEHEIQKHRESLAICTPITEDHYLQVNDSMNINCEIAHHTENVLETLTGLSFDLIEEIHQKDHQEPLKHLKLKASHETLDKISCSTLKFSSLLNQIEKNKEFFNVKVGDVKHKKMMDPPTDGLKDPDDTQEPIITITIHVKEIYKKKLPPVDHKFAKSMGFSSVQQMNRKLEKKYTDLENQRIETILHNDIINEFIKQNPPGFFSKYIFGPARKIFLKGAKTDIQDSGIASKQLINQKIKNWTKDGYIKKETERLLTELTTVINLAQKWNILDTIIYEFRNKVLTTPGLYEKLNSEIPPTKKGEPRIHPMIYEMIKRTVAKGLLSSAIITEVEPTDRDDEEHEILPEAMKATQSTVLYKS